MNLFYYPNIEGEELFLTEQESRHCVKVLRLKHSDPVHLTDGKGNLYMAEIIDPDIKKCRVKIKEKTAGYHKRNYYLHIAIAPTRQNDRFEWFLEKATEVGIDEITPIICKNSERKTIKSERLEKIIISALKQSVGTYKPKLNEPLQFNDFIHSIPDSENNFIAYCKEKQQVHLKDVFDPSRPVTILIGPEGDFTLDEIHMAAEKGIYSVSLGMNRLRTETAGIFTCCLIRLMSF